MHKKSMLEKKRFYLLDLHLLVFYGVEHLLFGGLVKLITLEKQTDVRSSYEVQRLLK